MSFCAPCVALWNSRKKRNQKLILSQSSSAEPHRCDQYEHDIPAEQHRCDQYEHDIQSGLGTSLLSTQLKGAHGFSISGNPTFTNIGMNTNVNNYGGAHGLEKVERFVSFAARFNSAEQDPDRMCHPGTRIFVLGRIQNWIDNPSIPERIFWLYGPAGAGKSAIAQTIAHSNTQEKVAATFFFYRTDPNRNDGNRLFTTLAWQLAFSIPAIKPFIVDALDKQPDLPMSNPETQFDQLIARPFQMLKNHTSQALQTLPVIIIDGVDECAEEKLQQRFLKVIGNAVADGRLPLRFLICSRPETQIKEAIDRFQTSPLSIDLAQLDDANQDIEKYLVDEFNRVASERDLDPILWPGGQAIQEIVFKSSGYFIFAATVIRCVGDPDNDPENQLDIILGLKPIRSTSPFAELDELYTEILRRQLDQDFLKSFLSLLVGRSMVQSSNSTHGLAEDDAILMNVSDKELRVKLRRMRSLLNFNPHIVVYHRSFIDFLIDWARSNQYHVPKEGGMTHWLELVVNFIVQCTTSVIEQPDNHKSYHDNPVFVGVLDMGGLPGIGLSVEVWQRVLPPLLHLHHRLLLLPNINSPWDILPCSNCFVFPAMRCLILHLTMLQGLSYKATTAGSAEKYDTLPTSAVMDMNVFEADLDRCLPLLLTWLRLSKSETLLTTQIMHSLLRFDHVEVAARVLSITDAQDLVDAIDRVMNDKNLLSKFSPNEIRGATWLALRLYAKALVIPPSVFLEINEVQETDVFAYWDSFGALIHTLFMHRILDRRFFVPSLMLCKVNGNVYLCNSRYTNVSMKQWREGIKFCSVTILKAMLGVAKTFQYFHSLGIILHPILVTLDEMYLDSNFRVKIRCRGWLSDFEKGWTIEANIFSFGCFFYETYFNVKVEEHRRWVLERNVVVKRPREPKIRDDAWQLIQRCCAEDARSQPTMDEVVQEMESWKLI